MRQGKGENVTSEMPTVAKDRLPMVALVFSLFSSSLFFIEPIAIFTSRLLGYDTDSLFGILFFLLLWHGVSFIGVALGVIALCHRKKRLGASGWILSIIAILLPPFLYLLKFLVISAPL